LAHKFIVVGAGIVGATIAYHLARSGHAVSVYDSGTPETRATHSSFGWINASFYIDANHHRLRAASLESWRQLQHDIQSESIRWPGCLCFEHSGDQLEAQYNALQTLDYECEIMARSEIRALCPNLPTLPTAALWLPQEGVAQSDRLTSELLHAATRAGVSLNTLHPVERLLERNGRVCGVQTKIGLEEADGVVIAAGVGSEALAKDIGLRLPMLSRPGVLLRTKPFAHVVDPIMVSSEMEFQQLPDGRFLAPTAAGHQSDESETLGDVAESAAIGLRTLRRLTGLDQLELEQAIVGWRPVPEDHLPVIGPGAVEGTYFAVMHSGVTLAALVGERVAQELSGQESSDLEVYRPARFMAS